MKPSVTVTENTAVIVVPADESTGVRATGFQINKGDKLDIAVTGRVKFSSDHPCVEADGMAGWEDLEVDSSFNHNVGGLEFSIGSLYDNRYLAAKHIRQQPIQAEFRFLELLKASKATAITTAVHLP